MGRENDAWLTDVPRRRALAKQIQLAIEISADAAGVPVFHGPSAEVSCYHVLSWIASAWEESMAALAPALAAGLLSDDDADHFMRLHMMEIAREAIPAEAMVAACVGGLLDA